MSIVGGLRTRLVHDSLLLTVEQAVQRIGWLDAGRQHEPITIVKEAFDEDGEIPINALAVTLENVLTEEVELGSTLVERQRIFWIEFYAESDVVGMHLIGDIQAYLEGRMPILRSIGHLEVFDFRMATPTVIFTCDIEDLRQYPPRRIEKKPYKRHWWAISGELIDFEPPS